MVLTSHVARVGFTKGTDKERSSSSLKGHAHILPFENRKNAGFFLQKNSHTKKCADNFWSFRDPLKPCHRLQIKQCFPRVSDSFIHSFIHTTKVY